ncbi:MAG: MarR family transcriptional regulator [Solirubrobacterales bacterium]
MSAGHQTTAPAAAEVRGLLADRVGYLLAKLHQRWAAESAAALREGGLGLTGVHFGALTIVDAAGPMSQQELGEMIGKDRTSVVAIVDDLEGEGLVERRRNPADRRAYALEVTRRGEDWLERARPALVAAEDRLLASLGPGERAELVERLKRILFDRPAG